MKTELINKKFRLKEDQAMLEHVGQESKLSKNKFLGRKGAEVTLIDICDDLAIVRNESNSTTYYTPFSNLL